MRDVYACRLPLADGGAPAFEQALGLVRGEVVRDLGVMPTVFGDDEGSLALPSAVTLRWRLLVAPGVEDRLWTLRWQHPNEDDSELMSHLNVDVALEEGCAWVGVRLALRPTGHRVLPVHFDIRTPRLVGAVVDGVEVAEDGWTLTREPAYAVDHDGVRALAQLILDPDRVLPVVVVTPVEVYDEGDDMYRFEHLVDPVDIADSLVGLAHVTVLETTALTFKLTELVGRELSVFGGAVRLYWPEVEEEDRPAFHPLWMPERLAEPRNNPFAPVLLRRVAATATFRVSAASLDARLRAAVEEHGRGEIARLFARAKDASLGPEWQRELERAWSEIERLREENAELALQLAVAHDNLRAMSRSAPPGVLDDESVAADDEADSPATVTEAVERARDECDFLVVLDDCFESARRATYRQPARLHKALSAMNEVAREWSRGELPTGFRDAFAERGFEFSAHVSPTTLGKYAHEYERNYEGRPVMMGPHLALGRGSPVACCRIYFYLDEDRHAFVVGHVGNHLSDSTSG
ncbi:MAG TPA: hypothetical protein VM142_07685 [Acidimicrobiales bacterium]|nr:hypothetical protein [Acidimicrobiales bacterium]